MKKPKRPFELEENELDSSKGVGMELEQQDEEDIIELEDILTDLPGEGVAEGIDAEEDLYFAELWDAESGMKLDLTDMDQELDEADILDEDALTEELFKEFPFNRELGGKPSESMAGEPAAVTDLEIDDQLDLDEDIFAKFKEEPVEDILPESKGEGLQFLAEREPVEAASVAALDEFVSQIESRLLQSVRELVEARLPDIVRMVLQEEIEKMKKESEI